MNIVAIKRPPSDLAALLRGLADQVERGEITDMVTAYVGANSYCFTYAASDHDCIVLSSMLQQNCIDRMRR